MTREFDPSTIPTPTFVEVPTFQELFEGMITMFKTFAPDYAYFLAADPVVKVIRLLALQQQHQYALLNERALAYFLPQAQGADLDSIGVFYGVTRMVIQEADETLTPPLPIVMEDDERYRRRIADGIVAFSAAGPAKHYRFHAMSSDPRVKDAAVYSPDMPNFLNMGGRVAVAILSTEETGVPSLDLLATVRQALLADDVRVVSDQLEIEPAAIRPIDLVIDLILERDAPPDIIQNLRLSIVEEFQKKQRMGWDAPKSWFIRQLTPDGVYEAKIIFPELTPVVRPNQFPSLASVDIRFAGIAVNDDWDNNELEAARLLRIVHEKYIAFAVANKRTRIEIQNDLIRTMRIGIVQPSLKGIVEYLGIPGASRLGVLLPADELAIMIHFTISKYYERGYYFTP